MTLPCNFSVKNKNILHSSIFNETLREWQGLSCSLTPTNLMYPIFIIEDDNELQPISSLPGIARYGINRLKEHLSVVVQNGLKSILIFGVIEKLTKDENAINADSPENPVIRALPLLRKWFPQLTLACDVCLCPYSSHGHCGILNQNGTINNSRSLERISDVALSYAKAG